MTARDPGRVVVTFVFSCVVVAAAVLAKRHHLEAVGVAALSISSAILTPEVIGLASGSPLGGSSPSTTSMSKFYLRVTEAPRRTLLVFFVGVVLSFAAIINERYTTNVTRSEALLVPAFVLMVGSAVAIEITRRVTAYPSESGVIDQSSANKWASTGQARLALGAALFILGTLLQLAGLLRA